MALIQLQYVTVKAFSTALGFNIHLSENQIQSALEKAHMASDGYYSLKHAEQWNTTFEFPQSAIDDDTKLWHQCSKDLATLYRTKQSALSSNRLSVRRVLQAFGPRGKMLHSDFMILMDFAPNEITPIVAEDFMQSNSPPPLRARYLTLKHTINCLLYKQHTEQMVLLLITSDAASIPGMHFSLQHQADSKGKPEGRVIVDLSGQHDAAYTPLNGTPSSKPALRSLTAATWGEIKHPTVDQLVLMVLTAADIHGWQNLILWKKDL